VHGSIACASDYRGGTRRNFRNAIADPRPTAAQCTLKIIAGSVKITVLDSLNTKSTWKQAFSHRHKKFTRADREGRNEKSGSRIFSENKSVERFFHGLAAQFENQTDIACGTLDP